MLETPPPPPTPSQELQDMAWVTTKKLWLGAHYPSQHAQWIGHSELMLKKTIVNLTNLLNDPICDFTII